MGSDEADRCRAGAGDDRRPVGGLGAAGGVPDAPHHVRGGIRGAGGTAAAAYAAGRPAEGHTILFGHAGSAIITPTITNQPQLKWDAFEPVARIHAEEEWLFGHPDSPWQTIDQVAAHAKAQPKQVRVAGSAIGGIDSFVVLSWEKAANIDVEYIPHEGGGKRSAIFPNVPTLKEKGWDVVMVQWRSVLAPKGTPAPRVAFLAEAFQKAMGADSWKAFNQNSKAIETYKSLGMAEAGYDVLELYPLPGGESLVQKIDN